MVFRKNIDAEVFNNQKLAITFVHSVIRLTVLK